MSKEIFVLLDIEWEKYDCDEYVAGQYSGGFYHEDSYLQLLLPVDEAMLSETSLHLIIGHAGCDGIEFCYRLEHKGIWAYYPQEQEYEFVATSLQQLVADWCNGSLSV